TPARPAAAGFRSVWTNNHDDLMSKSSVRQRLSAAPQLSKPRYGSKTEGPMGRLLALLYGIVSCFVFFVVFLYAIGFVSALGVPKTIDSGAAAPLLEALTIDILLM